MISYKGSVIISVNNITINFYFSRMKGLFESLEEMSRFNICCQDVGVHKSILLSLSPVHRP